LNTCDALLLLADGTSFYGKSIGIKGISVGEVVFNTSMTGYQEIITDPSYHSQIITFTNPHIGNTGINLEDLESKKIHASGIIIRDQEILANNWRKTDLLDNFLKENKIVGISGIDTRKLTKVLRNNGSQNGCIVCGNNPDIKIAKKSLDEFPGLENQDLAIEVTTNKNYKWSEGVHNIYDKDILNTKESFNVVAYDFGIKHNILRILRSFGYNLTVVPADLPAKEVLNLKPDGVFLSNGPGDPKACEYAIENIKILLENKIPLFGICLGFQLLAIASGAKTKKMKFGHHGANHPVLDIENKKVLITSQNHGFMVDSENLPKHIIPTHKSLFDDSLQGFVVKNRKAFGFQGHPEASPGPHDIHYIFEKFFTFMTQSKNA
jgi:carbamoyl-phosphate synthase small subunit